jgi:hypothetical protein
MQSYSLANVEQWLSLLDTNKPDIFGESPAHVSNPRQEKIIADSPKMDLKVMV